MYKIDLVGRRFGRLTVIKKAQKGTQFQPVLWACKCECGGKTNVQTANLVSGRTKSCGCLFKEMCLRRETMAHQWSADDDRPATIEELCDLVNW